VTNKTFDGNITNISSTKSASRDTWMKRWTELVEGLTITLEEDGDTLLTGPVIDQAALHGLLKKVRDLGMLWSRSVLSNRPGGSGRRQ